MHPLSIFPELLSFGFFAPLLLRVTLGFFVLYLGLKRYKGEYKWSSAIYFAISLMLVLGWFTQAISILGVALLKFDFYNDYWKKMGAREISPEKYFLYAMAIFISLSLLLTGPGAFAFDYPL